MDRKARPSPHAWDELRSLAQDDGGERSLLERLVALWRETFDAAAVGLYGERSGLLALEIGAGDGLPDEVGADDEITSFPLPGGRLYFVPGPDAPEATEPLEKDFLRRDSHPLSLLLASTFRGWRLRQELKDQQFQVNYRVVELEALYDVGLAIAGTLDLDRLTEEILLRASSLLDARRGALFLLEDGRYRRRQTFGGAAAPSFAADDAELHPFLVGGEAAPADLLPETRYQLGVPIEVESGRRGFLVVGDKESRRGVGPFLASDRRTLTLFANQAALALENARLHIQALEKERLESEMHLAADIQRQILPKGSPQVAGYEMCGWNRPARQVGGDYYDLFTLGNGAIGVLVGDVSGKGMPAALLVSTLHSGLRLLLDQVGFGPTLLQRLNRHLLESSTPNKFVTLLLAELTAETGVLRYLNAGHNPGILLRRDGRVEELVSSGVPLGLLPVAHYEVQSYDIAPGELVCIYSDGITEAESMTDEEFGLERLVEVLVGHREEPLPAVQAAILEAVASFSKGRPQGDDQTLVLVRRNP